MGICNSKQNCYSFKQQLQKINDESNGLPNLFACPRLSPQSFLNQLTEIKSQLEPVEYDYSNPHRQYNVLVDGILFDVVNSIEASFELE